MQPFSVTVGDSPIILAQPHGGTWLPDSLYQRLSENGRALADTDWHIARLYDGLLPKATIVQSHVHRYGIDANRDPAGQSLYPGQNTTTLCPVTDFDGIPIWRPGQEPSRDEIEARRQAWHAPYHRALHDQIDRLLARHGAVVVYDCHSIRSCIPFLFEGQLPVFSIGTNGGVTCAPVIEQIAVDHSRAAPKMETVVNGRFRGGWTTRHYGQPQIGVHAIQMELAQRAYLTQETAPWTYDPPRADHVRAILGPMLAEMDHVARSGAITPVSA